MPLLPSLLAFVPYAFKLLRKQVLRNHTFILHFYYIFITFVLLIRKYDFRISRTGKNQLYSKSWFLYIILYSYNTNFLIIAIPLASVINTAVPSTKYVCALPVLIDNNTSAMSISSSPGALFPGVESMSGTSLSL